jgi:uncharacterized coiled-coil DUF342 family protein
MQTSSPNSEVKKLFDRLRAEREPIAKQYEALSVKRDEVVAKMAPFEAQARDLAQQKKALAPRLAEYDRQLAALAKALGGRAMSDVP